jgi:uncharacterized protein YjbI with pentapeptide repeats
MANQEQLEKLLAGVDGWNKWREYNPSIHPNLEGANLRQLDLSKANFSKTNLRKSFLGGAYLSQTNLHNTDLSEAYLGGAYFSGTYHDKTHYDSLEKSYGDRLLRLYKIMDSEIKMDDDKLTLMTDNDSNRIQTRFTFSGKTVTYYVQMREYTLSGAIFKNAILEETNFIDVDLSGVKCLDEIIHGSYSFLGMKTIFLSKGKIPVKFLRGCGLSDWEIESAKLYLPGLSADQVTDIGYKVIQLRAGNPIQYYSVFISYSTKDQEFAQRLYDDLQDSGVRCWFAPHDVQGGKKLHEQIDSAIQRNDRTLLILSDASMESEWVKTEIAKTRQKESQEKRQVLFPIRLVDFSKIQEWVCFDADRGKDSAREIREYYIPDFSHWQEEKSYRPSFERLLKDLRAKAKDN